LIFLIVASRNKKTIYMKNLMYFLFLGAFLTACQAPVDNSANETFAKNSETVKAYLDAWQAESVDYATYFNENAWARPTGIGSKDSMSLEEMKANDQRNFATRDFKLQGEISFLPGVNTDTKQMDGSVRFYGLMNVTMPATDSSEAVSADIKFYQSYDFDENGKIMFVQTFGDWGGLREFFEDASEGEDDADEMEDEGTEE
jgi:hypothetical protein